MQCPEPHGNL